MLYAYKYKILTQQAIIELEYRQLKLFLILNYVFFIEFAKQNMLKITTS